MTIQQQQSSAREAVARWRTAAAATGPADRPAVERAVRAAYRAAGLAEPEVVLWFGSPLEAAAAALAVTGARPASELPAEVAARLAGAGVRPGGAVSVREAVRTAPWEAARRRVHTELGAPGWAELWALTGAELWPQTRTLAGRIRDAVLDRLAPEPDQDAPGDDWHRATAARTAARLALLDAVLGPQDAPWLAAFDAAGDLGPLAPLAEVAGGAGWWWPYEGVVLLSERPLALHRDEAGRLDRADGPALAYPDGFELHAWRGMPVPAEFLGGLSAVTPERIRAEENAELRRVLLEHYGYERYLADSGAEPLHRDETGVLWRIQLPDDEPVVMVEVVNSTAEPDGTFRTYWLRVPPATRTARAGVAWTFGVSAQDYRPQRET
ncbi:DUF6745 domain-containing protein [Kitasatospora sp. NPDC094015]|uniref:DUF6745 domain-containing protein n=1 Tax=Kitasatospora sp. NPDC094015 TaxID=3155205 RepID=UPI003325E6F9